MIPEVRDVTVTRNFSEDEGFDVSIDMSNIAHIISQLTNLYSDPLLAVIREYSTNAFDAHVEAGVTDPIEVTLPGRFGGDFVVRDHGIGMTLDTLRFVYSKYGASTKRHTNDLNGMLGFGCKAALTYVKSFSVQSVMGGVKVSASVHLNEEGIGRFEILDTCSTDEGNGTVITIPVKRTDVADFTEKAREFYAGWKSGTVLIDGVANVNRGDKPGLLKIGGAVLIPAERTWGRTTAAYVVMGNVTYPISNRVPLVQAAYDVYFELPTGSVNIVPSREALAEGPKTDAAINKMLEDFRLAVLDHVKAESTTFTCCATCYSIGSKRLSAMFDITSANPFPQYKHYYGAVSWIPTGLAIKGDYSDGERVYKEKVLRIAPEVTHFVTEFPKDVITRAQFLKASRYFDDESYIYFIQETVPDDWACAKHKDKHVDYATLAAFRDPVVEKAAPVKRVVEWSRHEGRYMRTRKDIEPGDTTVLYYTPSDAKGMGSWEGTNMVRPGDHAPDGVGVYRVRKPDLEAFKAAAPGAQHLFTYMREKAESLKAISEPAMNYRVGSSILNKIKGQQIDDPDVVAAIGAAAEVKKWNAEYVYVGRFINVMLTISRRPTFASRYPLLNFGSGSDATAAHIVSYMNHAYKEITE